MRKVAVIREVLGSLVMLSASAVIGFVLFAAAFKFNLLGSMQIVFYRGLVLILLCGVATFIILMLARMQIRVQDAFVAMVLSMSLNLTFLIVLPVTIDRSITVFLLSEMANRENAAFTANDLENLFKDRYLADFHQIDRRMQEQMASGNIASRDGKFVITKRGAAFIKFCRGVAWLFNTDPRFVGQATQSSDAKRGGKQ